jgi:16S rRNA processing protein RimM
MVINMYKQFLEAGQIVSTHGIKGELNVTPWCDQPEFLMGFDRFYFKEGKDGREERAVESVRTNKSLVIVKFEGINEIDEAVKLIKSIIYIDRSGVTLPEGSYFEQDLMGLEVIDDISGKSYGCLTSVLHTGANDVYGVTPLCIPQQGSVPQQGNTTQHGKEVLIPAIKDVIKAVDIEGGRMLITPLKGLFEDED